MNGENWTLEGAEAKTERSTRHFSSPCRRPTVNGNPAGFATLLAVSRVDMYDGLARSAQGTRNDCQASLLGGSVSGRGGSTKRSVRSDVRQGRINDVLCPNDDKCKRAQQSEGPAEILAVSETVGL